MPKWDWENGSYGGDGETCRGASIDNINRSGGEEPATRSGNGMLDHAQLTIIHVVRQFHPGIGGMENFVEQLALQQVTIGHKVEVVTLDRIFDDPTAARLSASDIRDGIKVTRVPFIGSLSHRPWRPVVHPKRGYCSRSRRGFLLRFPCGDGMAAPQAHGPHHAWRILSHAVYAPL